MRSLSFLLALVIGTSACDTDAPSADLLGAPPPSQSLELAMDPLLGGSPAWIEVRGAQPGALVDLVRTDGGFGNGLCPGFLGGLCMHILPGSTGYLPTLVRQANNQGVATWRIDELPMAPDADWWFQAVVRDGANSAVSNALVRPSRSCSPDAFEPNDALSTAPAVGSGRYSLNACPADVDYFHITLPEDGALYAEVENTAGVEGGSVKLRLLELDGNAISGRATTALEIANPGPAVDRLLEVRMEVDFGEVAGATYDLDLELRAPNAPCVDDGFEDDDTFASATIGGDTEERVVCPFDDDWLSYDLTPGEVVDWSLAARDVVFVTAFDPAGTVTTFEADDFVQGTFDTAGTHQLRIRYHNTGLAGGGVPYEVHAPRLSSVCIDDLLEDNDGLTSAAPIGPGTLHAVSCPGDADYFVIQLQAGDTLEVHDRLETQVLDRLETPVTLDLLSANGTLLDSDRRDVQTQALIDDYVFLRVTNVGAPSYGYDGYALDVQVHPEAPCIDDELEDNDVAADAILTQGGDRIDARACPGDVDHFAMDASAGQYLVFVAEHAAEEGIAMVLRDPSGAVVGRTNGSAEIGVYAASSGRYQLRVQADEDHPANPGVPYTLWNNSGPIHTCANDPYDPDNDEISTAPLLDQAGLSGLLCFEEMDTYRVDANIGDIVFITAGNDALRPVLLDSTGDIIAWERADAILHEVTTPGPLYVRLEWSVPTDAVPYDLTLLVSAPASCAVDAFEPNDTLGAATQLLPGTIHHAIGCETDEDVFVFDGVIGQVAEIELLHETPSTENLALNLYGPSGAWLADSDSNYLWDGSENIAHVLPATGRYSIWLETVDGGLVPDGVDYTIDLDLIDLPPCSDDTYEPNDSSAAATSIQPGTPLSAEACPGNGDWYTFLPTRSTARFQIVSQVPDGVAGALIYDASGNQLGYFGQLEDTINLPSGAVFVFVEMWREETMSPGGVQYELMIEEF